MRISKDYREDGWSSDQSPEDKERELEQREAQEAERRKNRRIPSRSEIDEELSIFLHNTLLRINQGQEVGSRTLTLLKEMLRTRMVLDARTEPEEPGEDGNDELLERLKKMAEGNGQEPASDS